MEAFLPSLKSILCVLMAIFKAFPINATIRLLKTLGKPLGPEYVGLSQFTAPVGSSYLGHLPYVEIVVWKKYVTIMGNSWISI